MDRLCQGYSPGCQLRGKGQSQTIGVALPGLSQAAVLGSGQFFLEGINSPQKGRSEKRKNYEHHKYSGGSRLSSSQIVSQERPKGPVNVLPVAQ